MSTKLRSWISKLRSWASQSALLSKVIYRFDRIFFRKNSYSSGGEDLIISGILNRYKLLTGEDYKLSYLDIGAFEPVRSSNTYFLYRMGSRGSIVEPNPYLVNLWKSSRPGDYLISAACGTGKKAALLIFGANAESNTTSGSFAKGITAQQRVEVSKQIEVDVYSLDELISLHRERFNQEFLIDLDVEGLDYEVLVNCDFLAGKPTILLVEDFHRDEATGVSEIHELVTKKGFCLYGRSINTAIYLDRHSTLFKTFSKDLDMSGEKIEMNSTAFSDRA